MTEREFEHDFMVAAMNGATRTLDHDQIATFRLMLNGRHPAWLACRDALRDLAHVIERHASQPPRPPPEPTEFETIGDGLMRTLGRPATNGGAT